MHEKLSPTSEAFPPPPSVRHHAGPRASADGDQHGDHLATFADVDGLALVNPTFAFPMALEPLELCRGGLAMDAADLKERENTQRNQEDCREARRCLASHFQLLGFTVLR